MQRRIHRAARRQRLHQPQRQLLDPGQILLQPIEILPLRRRLRRPSLALRGLTFCLSLVHTRPPRLRVRSGSANAQSPERRKSHMRQMLAYDTAETLRNTSQWFGATALSMASYPVFSQNPMLRWAAGWGEVVERSFHRMAVKPDWGIDAIPDASGVDRMVEVRAVMERPFGNLVRFCVDGRAELGRRVLLVAPLSGHYATLLRSTVKSLLPDCEVWVTDGKNARDIPVSAGKFDVEDYTAYLVEFMRELGPDLHVIAVCQPRAAGARGHRHARRGRARIAAAHAGADGRDGRSGRRAHRGDGFRPPLRHGPDRGDDDPARRPKA